MQRALNEHWGERDTLSCLREWEQQWEGVWGRWEAAWRVWRMSAAQHCCSKIPRWDQAQRSLERWAEVLHNEYSLRQQHLRGWQRERIRSKELSPIYFWQPGNPTLLPVKAFHPERTWQSQYPTQFHIPSQQLQRDYWRGRGPLGMAKWRGRIFQGLTESWAGGLAMQLTALVVQ